MLRREELLMCGKGGRCWDPPQAWRGEEVPEGAFSRVQPLKEREQPRRGFGRGRPSWHHRRRGRNPGSSRAHGRQHYYHQQREQQQAKAWPRCYRPTRPRVLLSLRPVNMMGKRAPGMRAPRNTNQFLMREKYQLMHLRSDSVGTESGGSDCEMDPLDMDSYLGVLENARGALMDCPSADGSPSPARAAVAALLPPDDTGLPPQAPGLRFFGESLEGALQEESLQYFPSEDDVIESEIFMERDFHEFCSSIA